MDQEHHQWSRTEEKGGRGADHPGKDGKDETLGQGYVK